MKKVKQWATEPVTKGWHTKLCVVSTVVVLIIGAVYWMVYFTEMPERIAASFKKLLRRIFRKRIPVDGNNQNRGE